MPAEIPPAVSPVPVAAPVTVMPEMLMFEFPPFVSVDVSELLLPT